MAGFKNILCYGSALSSFFHFVTSFLFKNILCYGSAVAGNPNCQILADLKTSYVMVRLEIIVEDLKIQDLFKNILCYGSACIVFIIVYECIVFKNILCYGSAIRG